MLGRFDSVVWSAIELSNACFRSHSEIYFFNSLFSHSQSPKNVISAIYKIRSKLRNLIRNQAQMFEIEALHEAIESGDSALLRGIIRSLSEEDRLEVLAILDKRYSLRSIFHTAIVGGHFNILLELTHRRSRRQRRRLLRGYSRRSCRKLIITTFYFLTFMHHSSGFGKRFWFLFLGFA